MRIQEDGHYSTRRLVDSRETTMPYVCVVQSVAAREEGVPASCRGWMIYKERDVIPLKSQQTRDEEEHYDDDEYSLRLKKHATTGYVPIKIVYV
jgi:hypothetical protein